MVIQNKVLRFIWENREDVSPIARRALLTGVLGAAGFLLRIAGAPAGSNHFRFAILGDRTGEAQAGVYERVWRELDLFHPDFVINSGDTIQGGDDSTAEKEWQEVRKTWRKYPYPLFLVPGNHDIWSAASEKLFTDYAGHPPFYSFDWQQAHFTVLDNSRTERLGDAQLKFLEQDLERHREQSPKFVFFHQPLLWLIPLKFRSDFGFDQLMRKYRVSMVVGGHTHQFDRLEKDGIVYLCAGSSGAHLRGHGRGEGFAQGWFYLHILATVTGSKVQLTVKEIDPPFGKGRRFDASEWGDHGLTAK